MAVPPQIKWLQNRWINNVNTLYNTLNELEDDIRDYTAGAYAGTFTPEQLEEASLDIASVQTIADSIAVIAQFLTALDAQGRRTTIVRLLEAKR